MLAPFVLAVLTLLAGLSAPGPAPAQPPPQTAVSAAAVKPLQVVDPARLKRDDAALASDAFLGRGPGEEGEAKTLTFLEDAFAREGLKPGGVDGGWLQPVPLVRLDRLPGAEMSFRVGDAVRPLVLGVDASLGLRNPGLTVLRDAPMVFGGFGVVDARLGWDAYAGVEVRGRIVVLLANDPDFEGGHDLGFEGRRMAYPGRFGAKVEAAARAGAAGVLVIHEDAAASYPFSQLASGDALPAFSPQPLQASSLKMSGWLRGDAAAALLKLCGLDLHSLKARARQRDFRAFTLQGARFSVSGSLTATPFISHNVIALRPGAGRSDETVLYGAHWDANGRNGPDARGDGIRNGAVDDGVGLSELIEIARAFAAAPPTARSLVFAAWTSEEKGLLGSDYYAAHPLRPLETTAAVINLDPHVMLGAARDVELIGGGRTDLEGRLKEAAASLHLRVDDEPHPEAGWYFRSDHFSFARRGVPSLAFRAGRDLVRGGFAEGERRTEAYNRLCYHQPCDEFDPAWSFAGAAQEADVAYGLGRRIADDPAWPQWTGAMEYKALRDASAAERR